MKSAGSYGSTMCYMIPPYPKPENTHKTENALLGAMKGVSSYCAFRCMHTHGVAGPSHCGWVPHILQQRCELAKHSNAYIGPAPHLPEASTHNQAQLTQCQCACILHSVRVCGSSCVSHHEPGLTGQPANTPTQTDHTHV